jgi:tetratricopeptide (TPR) repeat protein
MRTIYIQHVAAICLALCFGLHGLAQQPDAAKAKVHEGVELHDQGEFKKALKKYDEALKLDKDNGLAMAEKAMTLNAMGELENSAALCQEIILKHNGARDMPMVYVIYGNCMDQLGRPEASLRVYNEGIAILPEMFMLHFNKGVTLYGMDSLASAQAALQRSARLNPYHPGSQAILAEVLSKEGRRVPALMALCRLLVLEPEGARAQRYNPRIQGLIGANVSTDKKGNTTIQIDPDVLGQLEDSVVHENDFRMAETSLALLGSMNLAALITEALGKEGVDVAAPNAATRLQPQLDMLVGTLKDIRAKNFGFYWDYHASWLIAVQDAGHLNTLCHIVYADSGDKAVGKWLASNGDNVKAYYSWDKEYSDRYLKEK